MDIEQIPAGKFKAQCLKLMDEINRSRRPLVVTKHGKPMVKIMPALKAGKPKKLKAGFMKGSVKIMGDIVSPMHDVWDLDNWKFPY